MKEAGEPIRINVNAPPASGKSITAMAIANKILMKSFGRPININDIDRDQQEFSTSVRNPKMENTIRVIDEWNELETTGENSSTEMAAYNTYSDVYAQKNVGMISCSPTSDPDRNSLIYLEVISSDKVKGVNHCKLFYKVYSIGTEIKQLLGMVTIDVKPILKQEWYKRYRERKFEKMELMIQEGIFRPSKLTYAEITLKIVDRLRKLTKVSQVVTPNVIRNYVKIEARQHKIPQSIVGEELATKDVQGILDLYKAFYRMNKEMAKTEEEINKLIKQGMVTEARELELQRKDITQMRDEIRNAAEIQEQELERYRIINEKYSKVER